MTHRPTHLILTVLLIFLCITGIGTVSASSPDVDAAVEKALDYLAAHQMPDGGFAEPGAAVGAASPSWFAATAITAAGENPLDWKVNGISSLKFWDTPKEGAEGTGELGKMTTLLAQYGIDARNYNGHNYVAELQAKMKDTGQMGDFVYTTYWGIFGLVASGEDVSKPVAWMKKQQQANGGFGWADGALPDSDDTAAVIMALIAGGVSPDDPVITKAVQYLRDVQEPTGGFNYGYYSESNLASTVWVIQALCAAGVDPATVTNNGKSPVDYVLSLQQEDGSFRYTEYVVDSPTGMTGRAIPALMGKPYPVLPGQKAYDIRSSAYSGVTPATGSSSAAPADTPVPVTVATSATWEPVTLVDDFGYEITIEKEPVRIVSLAPANTEMLFALGLGDRMVGVTEYCNYPEEATTKPIIGGYTTVNVERVVAQKPDLVVAYYGNGAETVDHLKKLGLTVITMNSDSVNGTFHDIALLGKATGKTAEAAALTESMQKRIDAVTEKLKGVTTTPTAFHCVWADPLWVSGGQTFQDEIISLAGGTNPFQDVNGWGIITMERLLTTDPEMIIVDSGMGMGQGGYDVLKDYFYTEPRLQSLAAVKNKQVYVMNADIIDRGGPRIVDCLEELAQIIHPEVFGERNQATPAQGAPGFPVITALAVVCAAVLLIRRP